jgi:hypothetical protein
MAQIFGLGVSRSPRIWPQLQVTLRPILGVVSVAMYLKVLICNTYCRRIRRRQRRMNTRWPVIGARAQNPSEWLPWPLNAADCLPFSVEK